MKFTNLNLFRPILLGLVSVVSLFGLQIGSASALTVSPPTVSYTLNPSDTISDVIKLFNEEGTAVTLYPQINNFTFTEGDETSGTPNFYPQDEVRNGHELGQWITMSLEPITIQPLERYNLPFSVNVPANGSPGSHFGSIQLYSEPAKPETGSVGLVGGTGVLIFARVSGDVKDELSVSSFTADKNTYTSLPVNFETRLENKGNTHLIPAGNIFVKNMFGNQVASIQVNEDLRSILPDSARRFENNWFKRKLSEGASEFTRQWSNFAFGSYEATLVLTYGEKNQLVTATTKFWVFPWMVIATLVGGLAILLIILTVVMKQYNKALIRRYEAKRQQSS